MSALLSVITALVLVASPEVKGDGLLYMVVFDRSGQVVADAEVVVSGETASRTLKTDRRGAVRVVMPEGDVVVRLRRGDTWLEAGPVGVVAGHITEVVATASDSLSLIAEVPKPVVVTAELDGPKGRLTGRVEDTKGQPIRGARVFVRGLAGEVATDNEGRFSVEVVAGRVDFTVVHPSFSAKTTRDIEVNADASTEVTVTLDPAAAELDSFVVSAPRIVGSTLDTLVERRATTAVGEVLGAEQISKSGDTTAAAALRRVTGVTVIDGRFVYVRGLGERYASALLDGAQLPSPEPERRVVPLDMFPSALLEGIAIQKGWTADMPGEFGGGVVQIRTRDFPAEPTIRAQVSTGVRLGTTFEKGLMGEGGPTDFLGFDGGHRALPDDVAAASSKAPLLERDMFSERGYTEEELVGFGESMTTDWTPSRELVPPDLGLQFSIGTSADLGGDDRVGLFAALGYGSSWSLNEELARYFTVGGAGALELAHTYRFDELDHKVNLSGMLVTGLELKRHDLRLTSLVNRISSDNARIYQGNNRDVGTRIRVTRLQWVEQMLVANQLRGVHRLLGDPESPGLLLEWHYALSLATRVEPDRRQTRYDLEDSDVVWRLSDRPEGNRRVFSDLDDLAHDLGLSGRIDILDTSDLDLHLKVGAALLTKSRRVDTRRYRFQHQGALSRDVTVLSLPGEQIFSPEYIGGDGFMLTETTLETDNYTADQLIWAVFAMGELDIAERLDVVLGVRLESSSQEVGTFVPFSPTAESIGAELSTLDVLPSLVVSWEPVEGHFVRGGLARTVSRPDFRELSPATYNDVTGGRQYFGNPDLKRALLTHADLRWEWYPSERDLVSVGLFYKHFENPIEVVVVPSAQLSVTFANAETADNLGFELELRKSLDFIGPAFRDLFVAGNLALIDSSIRLDPSGTIQTTKERALQGQSPWVVNLQVGWEDVDLGTNLVLLWNVFGPRIVEVGALGAPDTYEEPLHQLDLVWQQKLGSWDLGLKAQNLLDPDARVTQGKETLTASRRGRNFAFSLGKSF